jgi:hypothetical protein
MEPPNSLHEIAFKSKARDGMALHEIRDKETPRKNHHPHFRENLTY